jgi:hypothetical protein
MRQAFRTLIVVLGWTLPGSRSVEARPPAKFAAADLKIGGLRLGQPIASFEERHAKTLCDRDPIDKKTRVIWFHAPKPCREAEPLPQRTVVVLYTKTKSPQDPLDAVAWFGNWPRTAGNFPAAVGIDRREADRVLGASQRLFDFGGIVDGGEQIVAWRHAGGVVSLIREGKVMGYVAGTMSTDPKREEWRGLVSNVLRYLR